VRKWLILPLGAALALVALLVWLAAEDARQAALLDTRILEARDRYWMLRVRELDLNMDGAYRRAGEVGLERIKAQVEFETLETERRQRQNSWPARLRGEVRRWLVW
jgi:hypothetical protein